VEVEVQEEEEVSVHEVSSAIWWLPAGCFTPRCRASADFRL
jgi:hypothetical protein